jgi:hypothetical protein
MTRAIRPVDEGTGFARALLGYDAAGAGRASDAQLMAAFCEHDLPVLMGAFSPRLVWEGAQARGMTTLELARLCAPETAAARRKANNELDVIQFEDSARYKPEGG